MRRAREGEGAPEIGVREIFGGGNHPVHLDRLGQVRSGLPAGGNRIRTIGPAPAKGSSGRCQSETAARRRSHLQVQVRNGNTCLEWLPIAFPFAEGPKVRIQLPPAASQLRT